MDKNELHKLDSIVSRQTIEIPSYYTMDNKGKITFDVESMKEEFDEKMKALKEKYEK